MAKFQVEPNSENFDFWAQARLEQIELRLESQRTESQQAHQELAKSIKNLEDRIFQVLLLVTGTLFATVVGFFLS